MANFRYAHFAHLLGTAGIDLEAAAAAGQIKVVLVMTNTTADTEQSVENLAGFTTLDEYDGTSYARQTLTGTAWTKDVANLRSELTGNDSVFPTLGAGTRQCQAAIVAYDPGGGDANVVPLTYVDTGGFPFDGTGSDNTVGWDDAGGLIYI
ncbi:MAG: hypothetical protein AAF682_19715 [Planctomycetota bacterium]